MKTTINFHNDLRMNTYWKKVSETEEYEIIKQQRNGLLQLRRISNGDIVSLPKRNINILRKHDTIHPLS